MYSYSQYEKTVINQFNTQRYLLFQRNIAILDPIKECYAIKDSLEKLIAKGDSTEPNHGIAETVCDTIIFTLMRFVKIYHDELSDYNKPINVTWPILMPLPAHVYWGDKCREIVCKYYISPDEMLGVVEKHVDPREWTSSELQKYLTEIKKLISFLKSISYEIFNIRIPEAKEYVNKNKDTAYSIGLFDNDHNPRFMYKE